MPIKEGNGERFNNLRNFSLRHLIPGIVSKITA
jgi:hypothetical protein